MALSTARMHKVRGRPPLLAAGITSLIHSHSSSVRSLGYIFSFIYPFYTTCKDFSDRLLEAEHHSATVCTTPTSVQRSAMECTTHILPHPAMSTRPPQDTPG